jgi:hypothetical protein
MTFGFRPDQILGPDFINNVQRYWDMFLIRTASNKPGDMGWDGYVRFLMQVPFYQEMFGAFPVHVIAEMLKKAHNDPSGLMRSSARQRRTEVNQQAESARDFFHHRMGDILGDGWFGSTTVDERGASRATATAIERLRQAGITGGLTPWQRQQALGPLRSLREELLHADSDGSRKHILDRFQKAMETAQDRLEKESVARITIAPDARRWINLQAGVYNNTLQGKQGTQGVPIPPGG